MADTVKRSVEGFRNLKQRPADGDKIPRILIPELHPQVAGADLPQNAGNLLHIGAQHLAGLAEGIRQLAEFVLRGDRNIRAQVPVPHFQREPHHILHRRKRAPQQQRDAHPEQNHPAAGDCQNNQRQLPGLAQRLLRTHHKRARKRLLHAGYGERNLNSIGILSRGFIRTGQKLFHSLRRKVAYMAAAFLPGPVRLPVPGAEQLAFLRVRNIGALPRQQKAVRRLVAAQIERDLVQRIQQHVAGGHADKRAGGVENRVADADDPRFFPGGNSGGKLYLIRLRNQGLARFLYDSVIGLIVILVIIIFHRHRHIAAAAESIGRKPVRRFVKIHIWLPRNIHGKNPLVLQNPGQHIIQKRAQLLLGQVKLPQLGHCERQRTGAGLHGIQVGCRQIGVLLRKVFDVLFGVAHHDPGKIQAQHRHDRRHHQRDQRHGLQRHAHGQPPDPGQIAYVEMDFAVRFLKNQRFDLLKQLR